MTTDEALVEQLARLLAKHDQPKFPDGQYEVFEATYRNQAVQVIDLVTRASVTTEPAEHVYLSTACLHGKHKKCGEMQRSRGDHTPPHCKYCSSPCICVCHTTTNGGTSC